jgi:hypothetical protein
MLLCDLIDHNIFDHRNQEVGTVQSLTGYSRRRLQAAIVSAVSQQAVSGLMRDRLLEIYALPEGRGDGNEDVLRMLQKSHGHAGQAGIRRRMDQDLASGFPDNSVYIGLELGRDLLHSTTSNFPLTKTRQGRLRGLALLHHFQLFQNHTQHIIDLVHHIVVLKAQCPLDSGFQESRPCNIIFFLIHVLLSRHILSSSMAKVPEKLAKNW